MGGIKDEALEQICEDYKLNGRKSFIYKYIWANEEKLQKKCEGLPKKEREKIISKRVRDFLYDLTTRSNNTALNMIDSWYSLQNRKKNRSLGDMSIEQYQKLFDTLQVDSESDSVLIPIRIDSKTGAGLYIVGKNNYLDGCFKYNSNYHCGLDILSNWENDELEQLGQCTSVKEAVKFFEATLSLYEEDILSEIRSLNGNMPKGCPKKLQQYFADYIPCEEDVLKITEADLEDTKKEFD